MTASDSLRRLPGPVRKIVEEKAGLLDLTPDELAVRVWEKEKLVPEKYTYVFDRLYTALYGVLVELQPVKARDAFYFGPKKKGEARPRLKDWALEVFRPSVVTTSSERLPDCRFVEEIYTDAGPALLVYTPSPESWEIVPEIEVEGTTYRPIPVDDKLRNALTLPDGVAEYDSLAELIQEAQKLTEEVYDPGSKTETPIWKLWVLNGIASWVAADLFANLPERFLPILAVIGPSGSGKKRALSMMRGISYRALYFLKTTRAPSLYRAIDPWGTVFLILDEADVYDSGEAADFIQFLNSRADGATIPRYSSEKGRNDNFLSFGITCLALRKTYSDTGTISRTTPLSAESTAKDLDLILTNGWAERARALRRKLLLWRLRTLVRIRRGELRVPSRLDLANVKAHRVKEALLVLAALGAEEPAVMEVVRSVGEELQQRLVRQNSDSIEGLILNVVYEWLDNDCEVVTDGTGFRLERRIGGKKQVVKDGRVEEQTEERRVPLTVKTIVESLGQTITFSECARWLRGLQFGIHPRKEIDGRRYKGIVRVLDPERLDRQFERFVVDAESKRGRFPDASRQRTFDCSDGGSGIPGATGVAASQPGQSGHPSPQGGPTGQSGPPITPYTPGNALSDEAGHRKKGDSTDGEPS